MSNLALSRRSILLGLTALALTSARVPSFAADATLSPKGRALALFLDTLGVESKWIAGAHIDWKTGLPDGKPENMPGNHTHCSAFVASAAKQLGVYILRPPEHGQVLLANAQSEWLSGDAGQTQGWQPIVSPADAQAAANQGMLVVASYHNHHDDKPGHIAIVRPSDRSAQALAQSGPEIIQAGSTNLRDASLKQGFAGHPAAWGKGEVRYYAHVIDVPLN